jgi:hypothetical protein
MRPFIQTREDAIRLQAASNFDQLGFAAIAPMDSRRRRMSRRQQDPRMEGFISHGSCCPGGVTASSRPTRSDAVASTPLANPRTLGRFPESFVIFTAHWVRAIALPDNLS